MVAARKRFENNKIATTALICMVGQGLTSKSGVSPRCTFSTKML